MTTPDTSPEAVAERVAEWRRIADRIAVSVSAPDSDRMEFALVKANATIDELNLSARLRAACDLIDALAADLAHWRQRAERAEATLAGGHGRALAADAAARAKRPRRGDDLGNAAGGGDV